MNPYKPADHALTYPPMPDELSGETARVLMNATDRLIAITNTDGTILSVNNRFARKYATGGKDPAGSSIYDTLPEGLRSDAKAMLNSVL